MEEPKVLSLEESKKIFDEVVDRMKKAEDEVEYWHDIAFGHKDNAERWKGLYERQCMVSTPRRSKKLVIEIDFLKKEIEELRNTVKELAI